MSHSTSTRTALITGATSGIGTVVADHLVNEGYHTIILGRNEHRLLESKDALIKKYPTGSINTILCDLSSLASVESACEKVLNEYQRIDLLVLNAGLWNFQHALSQDGIEETFQVNVIAPYLMFKRLHALLPTDGSAKVLITASALHHGTIHFDDIEFKQKFSGFNAYRQSKLADILLARHFANQPAFNAITFAAIHPGMVSTNLGRTAGWFSNLIFKTLGKTKEQGAKTHLSLIDRPNKSLISGEYYANGKVKRITKESNDLDLASKLVDTLEAYLKAWNEKQQKTNEF